MSLSLALKVAVLGIAFLTACGSVPSETLKPKGGDETEYARRAQQAIDAFSTTPRTIAGVQAAAGHFAAALAIKADDYALLCEGARACAWLGEFIESREERRPIIKDGLRYANTALELKPEGAEARFYHGVLAGLLGDVDHDYGLDAAKTVEADMKALIAKEADIANGGPWRVLGTLYLRAPGPPTSVGSLRNARKMLSMALEKAPDWPENHLYMAELEFAGDQKGNPAAANERLQKRLLGGAKAPLDYEFEFRQWQAKARLMLAMQK